MLLHTLTIPGLYTVYTLCTDYRFRQNSCVKLHLTRPLLCIWILRREGNIFWNIAASCGDHISRLTKRRAIDCNFFHTKWYDVGTGASRTSFKFHFRLDTSVSNLHRLMDVSLLMLHCSFQLFLCFLGDQNVAFMLKKPGNFFRGSNVFDSMHCYVIASKSVSFPQNRLYWVRVFYSSLFSYWILAPGNFLTFQDF